MGAAGLRRHVRAGGVVVGIYDGHAAALDTAGGRWVTVCEAHHATANHRTLRLAQGHARAPWTWCPRCAADRAAARAPLPVPQGAARLMDARDEGSNTRIVLWRHADGTLYLRAVHGADAVFFDGPPARVMLDLLRRGVRRGVWRLTWTRPTPYHCWHVCFCPACAARGGRWWDHAQASFTEHLRFVDNADLYTFPTVPEE